MKILVYTGNHYERFVFSEWKQHGGDGVCNQTVEMAQVFARRNHDVTVSGDVTTETHDGVKFIGTDDLEFGTHYDLVIAVSYLHYIAELDDRGITWDKSIFQLHYPDPSEWWRGQLLEGGGERYFRDDRMTWVVALSESHARAVSKNNPYATRKTRIIGNAIDPAEWGTATRTPGKFIFCSKDARALDTLLSIWPKLREADARSSLVVATPYTGNEEEVHEHPEMDGVTYLGSLSPARLREEIQSAEYWVNPSEHAEEYCLTALEMMMGGVKIVSTGFGNLRTLLPGHGAIVEVEDGDIATSTLRTVLEYRADPKRAEANAERASDFAGSQTWDARYDDWMALIESTPKPAVRHPELFSYFDDKAAWKKRFLSYAARTKEWELVAEEPFDSCFTLPLFTDEFCRMIREEAEHAESWTTDRHAHYPTTDLVLQVIGMEDIYREIISEYIVPCARTLWRLDNQWNRIRAETFLAKYTADAQGHLALHHDDSDITCLIQLSDLDEYEGGGTFFSRQKKVVKNGIGHATIHPGQITHRHGGRAISKGTRYIMVSFIHHER